MPPAKAEPSASTVVIEEATAADDDLVEAFVRLIPQLSSSSPPPGKQELTEIIRSPATVLLVAHDGEGKVVGSLTLVLFRIPTGLRAWIEDVVVDEGARGEGVGKALTEAALARAKSAGARSVDLTSRADRAAANRLYQRLGFESRATNVYRWKSRRHGRLGSGYGHVVTPSGGRAPRPLASRPPERLLSGPVELRRHAPRDLDPLVEAVNGSLEELRLWMPWAQSAATNDSIAQFLEQSRRAWEEGLEFGYAMRSPHDRGEQDEGGCDDGIIGCCGLHLRSGPGVIEIGYWVRTNRVGAGIATAAAGTLTRAALDLPGIERIEIHCDAANGKSRAIPAKLGYHLDRVEQRAAETPGQTDQNMIWVHTG